MKHIEYCFCMALAFNFVFSYDLGACRVVLSIASKRFSIQKFKVQYHPNYRMCTKNLVLCSVDKEERSTCSSYC